MTGKGGSGVGFRIFPELRKVLGCHMPNFRSLGQSLHIDNFCKIDGPGGGAPIILLFHKAENAFMKRIKSFVFNLASNILRDLLALVVSSLGLLFLEV